LTLGQFTGRSQSFRCDQLQYRTQHLHPLIMAEDRVCQDSLLEEDEKRQEVHRLGVD
jgi:hypothetical protein